MYRFLLIISFLFSFILLPTFANEDFEYQTLNSDWTLKKTTKRTECSGENLNYQLNKKLKDETIFVRLTAESNKYDYLIKKIKFTYIKSDESTYDFYNLKLYLKDKYAYGKLKNDKSLWSLVEKFYEKQDKTCIKINNQMKLSSNTHFSPQDKKKKTRCTKKINEDKDFLTYDNSEFEFNYDEEKSDLDNHFNNQVNINDITEIIEYPKNFEPIPFLKELWENEYIPYEVYDSLYDCITFPELKISDEDALKYVHKKFEDCVYDRLENYIKNNKIKDKIQIDEQSFIELAKKYINTVRFRNKNANLSGIIFYLMKEYQCWEIFFNEMKELLDLDKNSTYKAKVEVIEACMLYDKNNVKDAIEKLLNIEYTLNDKIIDRDGREAIARINLLNSWIRNFINPENGMKIFSGETVYITYPPDNKKDTMQMILRIKDLEKTNHELKLEAEKQENDKLIGHEGQDADNDRSSKPGRHSKKTVTSRLKSEIFFKQNPDMRKFYILRKKRMKSYNLTKLK